MKPFSVLLSVYAKESPVFFLESLNSIFNQSLVPNEVILVKDGPLPEGLEKAIMELSSCHSILKVVTLPTNQGLGIALNEGLKHCSYDIVARMDTDDIACFNRFEKQIEIFTKYPDIDVVGAWIDEFESNKFDIRTSRKLPETHDEILSFAKRRNPINHPVAMFNKQAVMVAGGYQDFPLFEDYYLWVRMLQSGAKFYNIQESLLYFRSSPDMFKRRGGWKYGCNELRFQLFLRKNNFTSFFEFITNISIRFVARIIPNGLRAKLYQKIIRK